MERIKRQRNRREFGKKNGKDIRGNGGGGEDEAGIHGGI